MTKAQLWHVYMGGAENTTAARWRSHTEHASVSFGRARRWQGVEALAPVAWLGLDPVPRPTHTNRGLVGKPTRESSHRPK